MCSIFFKLRQIILSLPPPFSHCLENHLYSGCIVSLPPPTKIKWHSHSSGVGSLFSFSFMCLCVLVLGCVQIHKCAGLYVKIENNLKSCYLGTIHLILLKGGFCCCFVFRYRVSFWPITHQVCQAGLSLSLRKPLACALSRSVLSF